ncbi:MAG: hypothetical protein ACFNOL_02175 [Treponema maltophilum]
MKTKNLRTACIFIALPAFLFIFASCTRDKDAYTIDMRNTDRIVLGERWALITEAYASYRIKPSYNASVAAHGRQGDIIKVGGTYIDDSSGAQKRTVWYRFSAGWLPENAVNVYANKLQAEGAAGKIK